METTNISHLILRELREIRKLLREYFRPKAPKEVDLPDLVEVTWILRELGIGRTTFYKHVKNKLLFPKLRIGNRDYFERHAVRNLKNAHERSHLPYRKLDRGNSPRQQAA
ncbi:hypothetical protein LS482_08660 [Sinomicrobium kalidii]|uniref:hypothetical protein n=1 Tax=Sinomicrobium kalidii TaxID=2900738 RepID=UPI001E57BD55|nr:hypothetical protein [Sinomicrobium kalidii]UGU17938.1 hypothetical protein LS482_08660 [Sinomicrobium kalidii]